MTESESELSIKEEKKEEVILEKPVEEPLAPEKITVKLPEHSEE